MAATAATSVVSTSLSIDQCNIVRRGRQFGNAHSELLKKQAAFAGRGGSEGGRDVIGQSRPAERCLHSLAAV